MTSLADLLRQIALGEDSRRQFVRGAPHVALEP